MSRSKRVASSAYQSTCALAASHAPSTFNFGPTVAATVGTAATTHRFTGLALQQREGGNDAFLGGRVGVCVCGVGGGMGGGGASRSLGLARLAKLDMRQGPMGTSFASPAALAASSAATA